MGLIIERLAALQDNYVWLLQDELTGMTAVIDPSEADPVLARLKDLGWGLDFIINTHHHPDHVGGNEALKAATGAKVMGPKYDRDKDRIPGLDIPLVEGDRVRLGVSSGAVWETPGHTSGHIAVWFEDAHALFVGDTLFALGCGRLFEGTAAQMWRALSRFKTTPPDTRIYCAHEYTQSNARFALAIEPDNAALQARAEAVAAARAAGQPTVPSLLSEELATNPFLRADRVEIAAALGLRGAAADAVFAELRRRKDSF